MAYFSARIFGARYFEADYFRAGVPVVPPPATTDPGLGGDEQDGRTRLSKEEIRAFLRARKRKADEKAARLAELQAAIDQAVESEAEPAVAVAAVKEIIARDVGGFEIPAADLQAMLGYLAQIDQQVAALMQRRAWDAAAILLLTEF